MRTFYIFEIICIMIFSIELNLRIISTPKISLIFYDIFNYLDLVNLKNFNRNKKNIFCFSRLLFYPVRFV